MIVVIMSPELFRNRQQCLHTSAVPVLKLLQNSDHERGEMDRTIKSNALHCTVSRTERITDDLSTV